MSTIGRMPSRISDNLSPQRARALLRAFQWAEKTLDIFRQEERRRAAAGTGAGEKGEQSKLVGWQPRTLMAIGELGDNASYGRIAEKLDEEFQTVGRPTLTQTLNWLTSSGYILKDAKNYVLTEKGKRVVKQLSEVETSVLAHFLAALPRDVEEPLLDGVKAWHDNFKTLTRSAGLDAQGIAGVYDALLGGGLNTALERQSANELQIELPWAREAALVNRAFLYRAVSHLAGDCKVKQFIDLGAGLPGTHSTYQIAVERGGKSKVVYLDSDPGVVERGKIIVRGCEGVTYHQGSFESFVELLRTRSAIFNDLDLKNEPVAVLLVAVLHFVPSNVVVEAVLKDLQSVLPEGSYLVISHGCRDETVMDEETCRLADHVAASYEERTGHPPRIRTTAEIKGFFEGWQTDPSDFCFAPEWRKDIENPYSGTMADLFEKNPGRSLNYVGIGKLGRKERPSRGKK